MDKILAGWKDELRALIIRRGNLNLATDIREYDYITGKITQLEECIKEIKDAKIIN